MKAKPVQRGGTLIDTGNIGYVKCLRQQMMLPGETINTRISGAVNMEALRERDALRLHAHLGVFLTPIRWIDLNFTDYLKDGPSGVVSLNTTLSRPNYFGLGGNVVREIPTYFVLNPYKVYNEWYKWPEDIDVLNLFQENGYPATNLEHTWTRCRNNVEPDSTDDYVMPSGSFTIQDLSKLQSRFETAMDMDVLTYNRYMELVKEMYGVDGTREVDKVPILIKQDQLGVRPRVMAATDSAGLGDYASVYDFNVDFKCKATAPEHSILSYYLTVRFSPITEETNPHLNLDDWAEVVGNPKILANSPPVAIKAKDLLDTDSTTQLGYLAAGYRWRTGWNQIGTRIDNRDSFPVMQMPTNADEAKDASRRVDAFRSSSLGDYRIDFFFDEKSYNPVGSALSSFKAGMDSGSKSDPYPKTGKVK